jgi:predicted RND superfamily exporter protein
MLRTEDIEWVKQYEALHEKRMSNKVRTGYFRLKARIKETLELLTELAKELPEQQKEQVFTEESLKPLIEALLTAEPYKENNYVINPRVFRVAGMLMLTAKSKGFDLIKNEITRILYPQQNKTSIMTTMYLLPK